MWLDVNDMDRHSFHTWKGSRWAHRNLRRFNETKCKMLHVGWGALHINPDWGMNRSKEALPRKTGVLEKESLDMSQPCALTAQKTNHVLG